MLKEYLLTLVFSLHRNRPQHLTMVICSSQWEVLCTVSLQICYTKKFGETDNETEESFLFCSSTIMQHICFSFLKSHVSGLTWAQKKSCLKIKSFENIPRISFSLFRRLPGNISPTHSLSGVWNRPARLHTSQGLSGVSGPTGF